MKKYPTKKESNTTTYSRDQHGGDVEHSPSTSHSEVLRRTQKDYESKGDKSEASKIKGDIAIHKSKERHNYKGLKLSSALRNKTRLSGNELHKNMSNTRESMTPVKGESLLQSLRRLTK